MKEGIGKKRRQGSRPGPFPGILPRVAFLACLALVMVALGAALAPVRPQEPAEVPFSERARSAALATTLQLRTASGQLAEAAGDPGAGLGQAAVSPTVTLLTTQARALLAPQDGRQDGAVAPSPAESSTTSAVSPPASVAALASALADSGSQRLADAGLADGGMARLLAAVGTGQLLEAASLAAAAGTPDPGSAGAARSAIPATGTGPAEAAGGPAAAAQQIPACPSLDGTPLPVPPAQDMSVARAEETVDAAAGEALAAVVRAEAATVYGYQVALPRLAGDAAQAAARHLSGHEAALKAAEALSRKHCFPVPPRQPGYTLDGSFLAAPAAGLAGLETSTLAVYGELVALGNGDTRRWGIAGLLEASRRAVHWGAEPGPLPGLAADPAAFPALPEESPAASPARR